MTALPPTGIVDPGARMTPEVLVPLVHAAWIVGYSLLALSLLQSE